MKNKNKVGILYICTGVYHVFWELFFESCEKHLLPDSEKHYFIYTDCKDLKHTENERVHIINQEQLPWPFPTLYRFKFFLRKEKQLKSMDYLFFFNSNLEIKNYVFEKDFLPSKDLNEDIVVVFHPGFLNKQNFEFTYYRNPKSKGFIPYGRGKFYAAGGLSGGRTEAYLKLSKKIDKMISKDYKKGIIAVWDDESYLNKAILYNHHVKVLPPSFLYPEGWNIPFENLIFIRDKQKYFNVWSIKSFKDKYNQADMDDQIFINRITRKLARYRLFRGFMNIFVNYPKKDLYPIYNKIKK